MKKIWKSCLIGAFGSQSLYCKRDWNVHRKYLPATRPMADAAMVHG